MIKNYLKEIKYNERKSFLNRKIDLNSDVIKPISEDVVNMIKGKFTFREDFDLSNEFEILRIDAALVKFKDESIPREAQKNELLNTLGASLKALIGSIENFDDYTFFELSNLVEKEIPGASEYINDKLSNHIQKILNVIEENNSTKVVSGPKKQNLKLFIVYKLLSIYRRGINENIVCYYNVHKEELYSGDTYDFLSICNKYLELDLGSSHSIAKFAKFFKNKT